MPSTTALHALRSLLVIAHRGGTRAVPAEEIADALGAPREYLAKTLRLLARAGLLSSARGSAGGYSLAAEPSAIPLVRVIDLFDATPAAPRCLLAAGACDAVQPCAAHDRWRAVEGARRAPLVETTLADLLDGRTPTDATASDP